MIQKANLRFTVDAKCYDGLMANLHHGQLTQLMQQIMRDLHGLITRNERDKIIDYMYKDKHLTLPKENTT
jgi:hypothetical protein